MKTSAPRRSPPSTGRRFNRSLAEMYPAVARQWHSKRNGELTPADVTPGSGKIVWWKCAGGHDHEWLASVANRARNGRGCPFCAGRKWPPSKSLAVRSRRLAAQWHPTRNEGLTPRDVSIADSRSVWWKCSKGPDHEWTANVHGRVLRGSGCPFCAGQRPSRAYSLRTANPGLAKQWHPSRNRSLTPADVVPGSRRKVWWRCPAGPDHEWRASIEQRTSRGTGCPVCAGLRVTASTSLAAIHPALARQWHRRLNGELRPTHVVAGSNKRVWWKCPKGPDHVWQDVVNNRTGRLGGCPFCLGRRASVTNSLAALHPRLAAQWHPTRNGKLRPADVPAGSGRRVWWKCRKGQDHEWVAQVYARVHSKRLCPFCIGHRVSRRSSLPARFPVLARQWHPDRNGDLRPRDVLATAHRVVWWKCPQGPDHEWQASVKARSTRPGRCPFCAGRRVSVTNNLATMFPRIAGEWHPTRNHALTPPDVLAADRRPVWWRCALQHVWLDTVRGRTSGRRGCPVCTGGSSWTAAAGRGR